MSAFITNLCLDPKPTGKSQLWKTFSFGGSSGVSISYPDGGGMQVSGTEKTSDGGAVITISNLEIGETYVASACLETDWGIAPNSDPTKLVLMVAPPGNHVKYDGVKRYVLTFVSTAKTVALRLYHPRNFVMTSTYSKVILCKKSDWEKLQVLGLDYFDYSTMPFTVN